ncbi:MULTISPECIES: hypothetical protein [unclassified Streptomyces]|uniref:hypothetical protein n=1 Tax=unclassified Streptomyces TaxID=2593676 RepID=UPI00224D761A|nr:hypothetical protein [Streptomyces sp. NBC_00047]
MQARADAAGLVDWQMSVDPTIMCAHQHAAGARRQPDAQREPPGGSTPDPGDHAMGRSRGGLSTKLHPACEHGQRPLSLVLSAGQAGDVPHLEAVMAGIRIARPEVGRPAAFDPIDCRGRHAVECGISRLKRHRAAATRFDKLAVRYLATVHITATNLLGGCPV